MDGWMDGRMVLELMRCDSKRRENAGRVSQEWYQAVLPTPVPPSVPPANNGTSSLPPFHMSQTPSSVHYIFLDCSVSTTTI